ncbi:hypothetical protein D9611_014642 [Ephemerocybe angulata]|uniref:Dynein heavy chain tail domain-containing protein n=1 Tax=Ephemerocybe angulata TaxID=980116 RepID=A0A8H5FIG9_9AGAR|nr:hypothetical protein D9611_014642 [Tulosesus angulatus]
MGVDGRLFEIVKVRVATTGASAIAAPASSGCTITSGQFQLAVNFDPQIITLFKEVSNLFQVPHAVTNMAKDAKKVYPHAVSLMETVGTYGQMLDLVPEKNRAVEG